MSTPKYLGRAIIQKDGAGLLCMLPTGHVKRYTSYARMVNGIKAWASKNTEPKEISSLHLVMYNGDDRHIYATSKSAA